LIPQTFYYFHAYAQLKRQGKDRVVFAVPSGNFGNIAAGLLAYKMGLPVEQFIAATNINDTVPRFLETGLYETRPSVQTHANAMDEGAPSNWIRIMDLFQNDAEAVKKLVTSYRFTDEETLQAMSEIFEKYNYIACPHTAIAYSALKKYGTDKEYGRVGVFLSTAHACKFPDVFPVELKEKIDNPEQVAALYLKEKKATKMAVSYPDFKEFLYSF
jgi:threonine synthase